MLPHLRKQRSGHIINISSVGGSVAFPGVGMYNATKFAVTGYSESLAKKLHRLELKSPLLHQVVCTHWAGRSANNTKIVIDDYKATAHTNQHTIRGNRRYFNRRSCSAAQAIIKIVETESSTRSFVPWSRRIKRNPEQDGRNAKRYRCLGRDNFMGR